MEVSTTSKVAALIALTGLLGIVILSTDTILWQSMSGTHAYALIAFVVMDFLVASGVIAKPGKGVLTMAAVWSAFRVVAQLADLYSANEMGLTYAQFADYLFNPLVVQAGNPPGVPAALLDIIIVIEVIVVVVSWKGRSAAHTS